MGDHTIRGSIDRRPGPLQWVPRASPACRLAHVAWSVRIACLMALYIQLSSLKMDNLRVGWRFLAQVRLATQKCVRPLALSAIQLTRSLATVAVSALSPDSSLTPLNTETAAERLGGHCFAGLGLSASLLSWQDLIGLFRTLVGTCRPDFYFFFRPVIGAMEDLLRPQWEYPSHPREGPDVWFRLISSKSAVTFLMFLFMLAVGSRGSRSAWTLSFGILNNPASGTRGVDPPWDRPCDRCCLEFVVATVLGLFDCSAHQCYLFRCTA